MEHSRYRSRVVRSVGGLSLGLLLALAGQPVAPLQPGGGGPAVAQAQGVNHPFSGQSIVYVSKNGQWQEAFIQQVSGRAAQGRQVWLYTVQYLSASLGVEANVTVDRMRSIDQAQAQGLTTNVYSLSSQAGIDQMLAAHNRVRREVGVADLRWSNTLAQSAQSWANSLLQNNRFEHSPNSLRNGGRVGENLTMRRSSAPGGSYTTPTRAVEGWVNERTYYSYANNTCQAGQMCGHYTQMVWKGTTEVGCGMARTPDATREVWVCHYNPAGNVVGQRPY